MILRKINHNFGFRENLRFAPKKFQGKSQVFPEGKSEIYPDEGKSQIYPEGKSEIFPETFVGRGEGGSQKSGKKVATA